MSYAKEKEAITARNPFHLNQKQLQLRIELNEPIDHHNDEKSRKKNKNLSYFNQF